MMEKEKNRSSGLSDAGAVNWLDLDRAFFYGGAGGFVGLRYGETDYKRVQFRRALPTRAPEEYISVADADGKEIGILRKLADLSEDQRAIASAELDRRYFCPLIREVKSARDKLGYVYMEFTVEAAGELRERSAAVNDVNRNIRLIDRDKLIIFDIDGNRFMADPLSALDKKSLRRLEPYIF